MFDSEMADSSYMVSKFKIPNSSSFTYQKAVPLHCQHDLLKVVIIPQFKKAFLE